MKNIRLLLSILMIAGALGACSNWTQDPLEGQVYRPKTGLPTPDGEKPKPGTPSDNIRIDTVSFYTFREEIEGSFKIEARVLVSGYSTKIFIDNLPDFPGAVFDEQTGVFRWTPPIGSAGGQDTAVRDLGIRIVAKSPGKADEVRMETRPMNIVKVNRAPVMISVKGQDEIREGEVGYLKVLVTDAGAGILADTWPTLVIYETTYYSNLAAFSSVTDVRRIRPGEFEFTVTVDLTNKELTASAESFGGEFIAYSASGIPSRGSVFSMMVMTSFSPLSTTWWDELVVTPGQRMKYNFVIFDPKDELVLEDPSFTGLPFGGILTCDTDRRSGSRKNCTLDWTPPASAPMGSFDITATVVTSNQASYKDSQKIVNTLTLPVLVVAPITNPHIQGRGY